MSDVCLRCGLPMAGERGSAVTLHGEAGVQHARCAAFYRGTATHYRKAPMQAQMQEIYSHDWGDGVVFAFNITNLRWRALAGGRKIIDVVVDTPQIPGLMAARSMAPADALHVYDRRTRAGTWDDPGLLVYHPDRGGSLMVDGNHRYVARSFVGVPTMRFYLFEYDELGPDVIKGVDLAYLNAHDKADPTWRPQL